MFKTYEVIEMLEEVKILDEDIGMFEMYEVIEMLEEGMGVDEALALLGVTPEEWEED